MEGCSAVLVVGAIILAVIFAAMFIGTLAWNDIVENVDFYLVLSGFIAAGFIIWCVYILCSKIHQRCKLKKERRDILNGQGTVTYHLLSELTIQNAHNYEERCLIEAYNRFVQDKNQQLRVEEYNAFIEAQKARLMDLNKRFGYREDFGIDRLTSPKLVSPLGDKTYMPSNFDKLYKAASQSAAWSDFLSKTKTIKTEEAKLFHTEIKEGYTSFFEGYTFAAIPLPSAGYLFFFPCYILYFDETSLKVLTYQSFHPTVTNDAERKVKREGYRVDRSNKRYLRSEFENSAWYDIFQTTRLHFVLGNGIKSSFICDHAQAFVRHYEAYVKSLQSQTFTDVFDAVFSKNEAHQLVVAAQKREEKEKFRKELIACKTIPAFCELTIPSLPSVFANEEERRLNNDYITYFNIKSENSCIEQHNKYIENITRQLMQLNVELGYEKTADVDKLPLKKAAKKWAISMLNRHTRQLYDHFSKKTDWEQFLFKIAKCKTNQDAMLIVKDPDNDRGKFFSLSNSGIVIDDGVLLFFPAYGVFVDEKKHIHVIPYNELTASVSFHDEKQKTRPRSYGAVVEQEYTYHNLDGTPDRRRKENPIIYTIRHFFLTLSARGIVNKKFECNDSELFVSALEDYISSLKGEPDATVLKNVLAGSETSVEMLVAAYLEKEEQERNKREAHIEKKRQEKEAEERKRKEALIKEQRERNAEQQRKRAAQNNALRLFGEDVAEEKHAETGEKVVESETSSMAFSVLNKRPITNNVFKIELRQEMTLDEGELDIQFVDTSRNPISNKRVLKTVAVGESMITGITLLPNIDFTTMDKCVMRISAKEQLVAELPFEMNISFYSDF